MNFKISREKLILLVVVISAILAVWFLIIVPKWQVNIENKIAAANYCEIESDCVVDYFQGLTCGGYVNKNEESGINKEIKLYRLLSFEYTGCMGGIWSSTPKCENKKCIGDIVGY